MDKAFRIVFIGPESTGKTTLSRELASFYKAPYVPEYARTYLELINCQYKESDLLKIAQGQLDAEKRQANTESSLLICDTNLLVIKVWSEYKYGRCDPWILEQLKTLHYDLFFLCSPDIPWTFDPQRENPNNRNELYQIFKQELLRYRSPFVELTGNLPERKNKAIAVINGLLLLKTV